MEPKKQEDMIFNQYEDSIEDEKANQEAFERSIQFSDENKDERFKKLSFLNSRSSEDPEEEFTLVKPPIDVHKSPKIEIENSFLNAIQKGKSGSSPKQHKRGIIGSADLLTLIDEDYQHKPIEFEKSAKLGAFGGDLICSEEANDSKEFFGSLLNLESGQENEQSAENTKLKKRDEKALNKQNESKEEENEVKEAKEK